MISFERSLALQKYSKTNNVKYYYLNIYEYLLYYLFILKLVLSND